MGKKLYVGNLPFSASDDSLQQIFSQAGTVQSAKVIMDRDSGRSKGFGFVEMADEQTAQQAIERLNGKDLMGRNVTIAIARPQEKRGGDFGQRGRY